MSKTTESEKKKTRGEWEITAALGKMFAYGQAQIFFEDVDLGLYAEALPPLRSVHTVGWKPTFSEAKARANRAAREFENAVLWVRKEYGQDPVKLREILEDESLDIDSRTAAGLVLTQLVQEQATKISRKTRAFEHGSSAT